jgi:hypothetical protein
MFLRKLIAALMLMGLSTMSFAQLSLGDLGFKTEDLKVDPEVTKTIEVRKDKLATHQKLGLATMGVMTATMIMAESAKDNDVHKYLGIASGLMYWTTAYFSLSAPEIQGAKDSGSSKIHKTLSWIHMPLMVAAPILGYLHKKNLDDHKTSSSLVKNHGGVGSAAYASFMLAGLVMYFDFSF